jgi:chitin synthase
LTGLSLALSTSGIDVENGLLHIPGESGYRAFDVFYYLLTTASTPAEREFLGLKHASTYSLLNKSGTYDPPSYLPAADDAAAAEDFRASLKAIGIKGSAYRGFLSALAGLLKLGETTGFLVDSEALEDICEDVGGLIGLEPEVLARGCNTNDREVFIAGMYEALVDWVIAKANEAIARELHQGKEGASTPENGSHAGDSVNLTVVEIPGEALGKAVAMRSVFDDNLGINAEMKQDGVEIIPVGHSVLKEMTTAVTEVEADLGIKGGPLSREREYDHDRRQGILERIGAEAEEGGFLRTLLFPVEGEGLNFGKKGRFDLATIISSSRVWHQLSLHPTDELPSSLASLRSTTSAWSAGAVSRQLRAWRLPEWTNRRNKHIDFTSDFDVDEFVTRYSRLGCQEGKDGIETFLLERGWTNGEVVIGNERIWMRESAWWEAESMLDLKPTQPFFGQDAGMRVETPTDPFATSHSAVAPHSGGGYFPVPESQENLLDQHQSIMSPSVVGGAKSVAPTAVKHAIGGDYGLGWKGDDRKNDAIYYDDELGRYTGELDPEFGDPKRIESKKTSAGRYVWVSVVWAMTWFIPSFALRLIGRMKRPDVRLAWREKLVLMFFIFFLNACVVFYIVEFGRLLCPNFDKAWNAQEVSQHQGDDDFYVSIHGKVYDISKFWKLQHSDTAIKTTQDVMQPFAGLNLDVYFEPPLSQACPGLNVAVTVQLQHNDTGAVMYPAALHTSGPVFQTDPNTALHSWTWYSNVFQPKIQQYYKGDLVVSKSSIYSQGQNDQRFWVVINNGIYDLTDYLYTLGLENGFDTYSYFPNEVTTLFQDNPGMDITDQWGDSVAFQNSMNCLQNAFYQGKPDFRNSAKCQVNNYILLAFTIVLCSVILIKFLAALQLGSKPRPAAQDKFVICQVPAYTEGEDQLRKSLDSLTALQYDNKRKLICVVCDGMATGGGNERPTPKIVLDILGVDPKTDPPALPFRSVGNGSEQLNYAKVYSGLYEYEGNVVPYLVIVKVGKESEQSKSKPGNRGKRDSQILLMQFLNRVHFRSPMSPMELEMFHQINNIIGVDPELYEYLFMVDADTRVKEDSLNRLVAACANDAKIAGICGETSLDNEEGSWWTMIQVYEYYISHHLAKAFESLFGSVTCLPGW